MKEKKIVNKLFKQMQLPVKSMFFFWLNSKLQHCISFLRVVWKCWCVQFRSDKYYWNWSTCFDHQFMVHFDFTYIKNTFSRLKCKRFIPFHCVYSVLQYLNIRAFVYVYFVIVLLLYHLPNSQGLVDYIIYWISLVFLSRYFHLE